MLKSAKKTMAEFNEELTEMGLRGQWIYDELLERLVDGPIPVGAPHIWKWEKVEPKLMETLELMQESYTARRNFSFINPTSQVGGTTQNILAGMQVVKPGEVAWGHRHSISALRFAIEGNERLYTVVNGEPLKMETNDLVLTPAWSWHDHHNEGDVLGIWLDVLDVPFVRSIGQLAYEPLGEVSQPIAPAQLHQCNHVDLIRPRWEQHQNETVPYRYAWSDVERQMQAFGDVEGSPYDGLVFEYANPGTAGPTLPTLTCAIHNLKPGFAGRRCRKTSSVVFYVVEGEGSTTIDDTELKWGPKDVFAIPSWAWYEHRNNSSTSRAVLFSTDDSPVLISAGLYREETA